MGTLTTICFMWKGGPVQNIVMYMMLGCSGPGNGTPLFVVQLIGTICCEFGMEGCGYKWTCRFHQHLVGASRYPHNCDLPGRPITDLRAHAR